MTRQIAPGLLLLAVFYGGLDCIAGVLGAKLVALGPLVVEGGVFAFVLLVATGSAATELYGASLGRRLVLIGFVPLIVAALLIWLVIVLPPADIWAARQPAFAGLLGQSSRMMAAGLIAYGISQTLNVSVFAWLKGREGSTLLWPRAIVASVLSQLIDTGLFVTISFWGVAPIGRILPGQALAKVVLSIALVPPVIYALVGLARRLDRAPTPIDSAPGVTPRAPPSSS